MAKAAKNTVTSPGQQTEVPGTESKVYPDIEEAAVEYREIRDKRMQYTKREVTALENLAKKLEEHNVDIYKFSTEDGERLKVERKVAKIKVSVRKDKNGSGGDDENEGPEVTGND